MDVLSAQGKLDRLPDLARDLVRRNVDVIVDVFLTARAARAEALAILASPALPGHEARLAQLSLRNRLPAIYYSRGFAQAGGLMRSSSRTGRRL